MPLQFINEINEKVYANPENDPTNETAQLWYTIMGQELDLEAKGVEIANLWYEVMKA